jgi:hypothetical protein
MVYEGTIGIHQSLGGSGARFGVVFAPYDSKDEGPSWVVRQFSVLQQVGAFLKALGIRKDLIANALRELVAGRSAVIPGVVLTEKVVQRRGLDSTSSSKRRVG